MGPISSYPQPCTSNPNTCLHAFVATQHENYLLQACCVSLLIKLWHNPTWRPQQASTPVLLLDCLEMLAQQQSRPLPGPARADELAPAPMSSEQRDCALNPWGTWLGFPFVRNFPHKSFVRTHPFPTFFTFSPSNLPSVSIRQAK